jgi:hypothetical protein
MHTCHRRAPKRSERFPRPHFFLRLQNPEAWLPRSERDLSRFFSMPADRPPKEALLGAGRPKENGVLKITQDKLSLVVLVFLVNLSARLTKHPMIFRSRSAKRPVLAVRPRKLE